MYLNNKNIIRLGIISETRIFMNKSIQIFPLIINEETTYDSNANIMNNNMYPMVSL